MERHYVAVDLHALRSMLVRENEAADEQAVTKIDNRPMALAGALADVAPHPDFAIVAPLGCSWAVVDRDVVMSERRIHQELRKHPGYRAIQRLNGVGRVLAAIFVAEIGDVGPFSCPEALCSWAGLTPKHKESDRKARRGKMTKKG